MSRRTTGKGFGDPRNPLLVSVRSGAKFSMPGMMDTVLNLGLNSATLEELAKLTNDRRFALDAHRRFIQLFSKIVLGIDGQLFEDALDKIKKRKKAKTDADLTAPALEELIVEYRAIVKRHSRTGFPEDPMDQLRAAIGAVFEVVEQQARDRLSQLQPHPARPRHRGERAVDGLRQHG